MHQATPITESLQAATYDQNVRIGELPFFESAAARQVAPESYVALLRGLKTIYAAFEQALAQSGDAAAQRVWGGDLHKQGLLDHDLAACGAAPTAHIPAAELSAEALAEHIRLRAASRPRSLIGSAYALATWYVGGAEVCAHLHALLGLPAEAGVSYLASFERWGQRHWPAFAARLNDVALDERGHHEAVQAAREALNGIEQLIYELHPINRAPIGNLVRVLNLEAGNHPIADDMAEIKAMMRAHQRNIAIFPYWDMRYGMRGRKFSWSDGGWLIALVGEEQEIVNHQVRWLTRLLAVRGMPQWLMEVYLQILAEELSSAVPAKAALYAKLTEAARMLAEERRATISDEQMGQLDARFYAQVGAGWQAWMPNCGGLLAAAVADERAGVAHAVAAIAGWMTDPARFPEAWIAAVHDLIAQARGFQGDGVIER